MIGILKKSALALALAVGVGGLAFSAQARPN